MTDLFKRTGWQWVDYGTFVDVHPLDDEKEHAIGDECWCAPKVKQGRHAVPLIAHNSADKREENESDHWQERYMEL